jgi:hypothetical protein
MGSNRRCSEPSSSTSRSPPIDLPRTSRKIGTHPTITVTEKLVLDGEPEVTRRATAFPDHLVKIRRDGVADPAEDDDVHLNPPWLRDPGGGGAYGETLGWQPPVSCLLRQPLWAETNTNAGGSPTTL